jgi:hypothetical protein
VKQRADPLGNPLPENYQPLKNPDAFKVSQLFLTGETFGSSSWFRQDAKTSAAVFDLNLNKSSLTVTGATSKGAQDMASTIGNKPGKSIAADLNGNGIDEVIAAVANKATNEIDLYVLTYNADGTHKTAALQGSFQGVNIKAPPNYGNSTMWAGLISSHDDVQAYFAYMDIAAGDLDGDGKKEIIVTEGNLLAIFKNESDESGIRLTKVKEWSDSDTNTLFLRIDVGDFDADGADELVIANSGGNAYYKIFKGLSMALIAEGAVKGSSTTVSFAEVVTGDFDNDGLIDIAFGGIGGRTSPPSSRPITLSILKTGMKKEGNISKPTFTFLSTYINVGNSRIDQLLEPMAAGYPFTGEGAHLYIRGKFYWVEGNSIKEKSVNMGVQNITSYTEMPRLAFMADLTGTGQSDLALLTFRKYTNGTTEYYLKIGGYNPMPRDQAAFTAYREEKLSSIYSDAYFNLCMPSILSGKSLKLKFLQHRVEFTDPIITAVVASPPYVAGANDSGTGSTTFGRSVGYGSDTSASHGFSVEGAIGASIGFKVFGFGVESEILAVAGTQFMWGTAESFEFTESWGYTTETSTDMVVFTAIPFDVYYYEILDAPADGPASEQPGDLTMISVPRKPLGPVTMPVEEYNSRNPGYSISRGMGGILRHTLGSPYSYAKWSDVAGIKAAAGNEGLFSSWDHKATVGMGNTTTTLNIEMLKSQSSTYDSSWNVGVKTSVEAAGVKIELDTRYQGEYSHTTSVSGSTWIEGTVPGLPSGVWDQNIFAWGIMCYPYNDAANNQAFPVVTYWVEKN